MSWHHDDVIKWKNFPRNWPFVRGIHRSGEFHTQRPVTRSFDVFYDLRLNKRLSKQSWGWWFETLWCSLWRHRNGARRVLGHQQSHRESHDRIQIHFRWLNINWLARTSKVSRHRAAGIKQNRDGTLSRLTDVCVKMGPVITSSNMTWYCIQISNV